MAANQQVRGFGTRLMNHTKAMARDKDGLTHFLTYADNNAVGYFTKQVWHTQHVTTLVPSCAPVLEGARGCRVDAWLVCRACLLQQPGRVSW